MPDGTTIDVVHLIAVLASFITSLVIFVGMMPTFRFDRKEMYFVWGEMAFVSAITCGMVSLFKFTQFMPEATLFWFLSGSYFFFKAMRHINPKKD